MRGRRTYVALTAHQPSQSEEAKQTDPAPIGTVFRNSPLYTLRIVVAGGGALL
jgi:hypothetical protein